MFQNLTERLGSIFKNLGRHGALTEQDVASALNEIRGALIEADVALPVVKSFIESIQQKAVGQKIVSSITPAQMVIKIVHEEIISLLGEAALLNLSITPPAVILMAGLQGSGKTTTSGKLAKLLKEKQGKKVLLASLDIYRPAAQQQLEIVAQSLNIASLPIITGEDPLTIATRALKVAKSSGIDVVIFDTAGRLHIDAPLMEELKAIAKLTNPIETLLVVDAMTGQDATLIAENFQKSLALTGIIMTRIDGDARGGATLSMRYLTNCPIKFMGVGEKLDQLEVFYPNRVADRILDQGDIISLVEKTVDTFDKEEVEKLNRKIERGSFDLGDMATQLKQMLKMGGIASVFKMLPGFGGLKDKISSPGVDDRVIKRQIAIIQAMTPKERRYPKLLNASRRIRISKGSGTTVPEINTLLKQFESTTKMMKQFNKLGAKGLLRQGLKGLFQ